MPETKHKQAIWESSKHATPDYAPQYGIHNGEGNDFAIIRGENAKELTAQILREHNSHDELVAALEAIQEELRLNQGCMIE